MKTSLFTRACLLASVAALNVNFSPLRAQTPSNPPITPAQPNGAADTKSTDSTAEQNSGGANGSQANTDSANMEHSKSMTNSLDNSASQAPTDSADKSATKMPNDTTSDKKMSKHSDSDDMKMTDAMFTKKAAIGGMFEVEAGKLAADKGSDKVKDFGNKMVEDHGMANDKLKSIAGDKSIMVPDKVDEKHQMMLDKLTALSGPAFDKMYLSDMTKAHTMDLALFKKEAATTSDDSYKSFATDTTKVIEMHISMLKDIKAGMMK